MQHPYRASQMHDDQPSDRIVVVRSIEVGSTRRLCAFILRWSHTARCLATKSPSPGTSRSTARSFKTAVIGVQAGGTNRSMLGKPKHNVEEAIRGAAAYSVRLLSDALVKLFIHR